MKHHSQKSILNHKPWKAFALITVSTFSLGIFAEANFNGSFSATESERFVHRQNINELARVTYACMKREIQHHQSFYKRWRISPFYGTGTEYAKLDERGRQNYLKRMGLPTYLTAELEATSCVGFAIKCYKEGFQAIGQANVWARINSYALQNSVDGSSIIDALQKLGWKVMYWNPDTKQNKAWDAKEKKADPTNKKRFWGYHEYRDITVNRHGRYYKNYVDDKKTLVNFGTRVPKSFTDAPLFLGIAHTGYHVFPGAFGHIIEAHSTRSLTDYNSIEQANFNPLQNGGAPRGEYYSGLIAVPPGY